MADTMTPISDLLGLTSDALTASVAERLEELGLRLQEETHSDLRTEVREDGEKVTLTIHVDDDTEQGTSWSYQDREGNWHTTTGMRANPFIQQALDDILPSLDDLADDILNDLGKG